MSEHTPTPWRKNGLVVAATNYDIANAFCRESLSLNGYRAPNRAKAEANAAFIVRAVNAHDDLLAACKMLLRGDGSAARPYQCEIHLTVQEVDQLRAAISKATKAEAKP